MKNSKKIVVYLGILSMGLIFSCKKTYLSAKPDQALIIPESLEELQSLMDASNMMNGLGYGIVSAFAEIASDNYYIDPALLTEDNLGNDVNAIKSLYT